MSKKTRKTEVAQSSDLRKDIRNRDREKKNNEGLCLNCVKRDWCRLPKPEGGVWRCEEYSEQ